MINFYKIQLVEFVSNFGRVTYPINRAYSIISEGVGLMGLGEGIRNKGIFLAILLVASVLSPIFDLIKPASALPSVSFSINFDTFPDNNIVPSNTLISNQYQPVGVTFTSGNGPPLAVASPNAASPPNILIWQGSGIITVNVVDPTTGTPLLLRQSV